MASTERREQPTTAKRAAIQAAVLEATEELLSEGVSFADLGIEKIATRAGISRTAFYFYFADKRELLMRLSEEVTDELYTQADIWYSGSGDPEAEIREAIGNIAQLYEQHGPLLRAIVEVSTYDEEVASAWRSLVGRFITATEARIETERGNLKLAQQPFKNYKGKPDRHVFVETRGEGGYALAPGTPADCHETGRLYLYHSGPTVSQLPNITAAERAILHRCARFFDEMPVEEEPEAKKKKPDSGGLKPGEDYCKRGPAWPEILEPHGWTKVGGDGQRVRWRRPGKDGPGWSATTG